MKQSACIYLLLLLATLTFISCNPMKKDVGSDNADNVVEFIISESNGEYFLISKEEIFQATSKSDNNGIRQITGFTEYRISCYDLNTGNLISRVILGDRKENGCDFLGETKGVIWYKSVNPELGFHARDPKTLEVIISQEKITNVNPFLKGNLSQPEWNNVTKYYGFDIYKQMPMISDNSGFLYFIDPATLKAEKTGESVKNIKYDNDCLTTSVKLNENIPLYLKGSPRNHIETGKSEFEDISFLKGEYIESSVQLNPHDAYNDDSYDSEIKKYEHQIDSLQKIMSEISPQTKNIWIERNIESLKKKIQQSDHKKKKNTESENFNLITSDKCIFVYSQTDVTDQSKVLISKIKIGSDPSVVLVWQTKLDNIYSDPVKGLDRSAFETVFSKGDPDLDTKRAVMGNGKLIFMSMLMAVCIDIETGKVLWEKEL